MSNPFPVSALGLARSANLPPGRMDLPVMAVYDDFTGGSGLTTQFAATLTERYTIGGTNSSATSVAILTTSDRGYARFTTGGTSGDETSMVHNSAAVQWGQSATAPRPWVFRANVIINTITTSTQVIGVGPYNDVTLTGGGAATSADFYIVSGAVSYGYITSATTVNATAITDAQGNAVTVTAGSEHIFQIEWDGKATLSYLMDGVLLKQVVPPAFTAANVTAHGGINTTSAAAKTMDLDYWILIGDGPATGR